MDHTKVGAEHEDRSGQAVPKMVNFVVTYFSDPDPEGRRKRLKERPGPRTPYTDYYYV
ncbi:MAG: hypothetical protein R6V01_08615 [Thermoplasmatota archaeon]